MLLLWWFEGPETDCNKKSTLTSEIGSLLEFGELLNNVR